MNPIHPNTLFDLSAFRYKLLFLGCNMPWEVLNKIAPFLKSIPLGKIEVGIPEGAHLIHPELISIGKGTLVEPGAYIRGPCIIGENCTIRQGAYIRGDVIVGDRSIIGHDTEIKNTIILDDAAAAHFAYLGDCILGNRVNMGAGTKCANFRLDHKEIVFHGLEEHLPTGLRKLGAIFGDGTQIGCNSVSNPGTITGKGVHCYPCLNFGGFIPENSIIKPPHQPFVVSDRL